MHVFLLLGSCGLMAHPCQILNFLEHSPFTSLSSLSKASAQCRQMTNESQRKWSTRVLDTQIHCSGVEVPAPSNYNQWRLIPDFEKKKKKPSMTLSVPTESIMSKNMCQQRGYPTHLLTLILQFNPNNIQLEVSASVSQHITFW